VTLGLRFDARRDEYWGKRWRSAAGFTGRKEAAILEDCIRVIDAFMTHQRARWAGVAPCSPFSVSRDLMRDAAILARQRRDAAHSFGGKNDEISRI
jgi:cytosine/adenosine deaminase-related metal-dependent hydrolase